MTLGERVYQIRTARGLSQSDLAEALDVSRQSVSKWETDASVPDLDKLVKMCELFGVSMDALVRGEAPGREDGTQAVYVQAGGGLTVRTVIGLMLVFFGLLIFSAALLYVRTSLENCLVYSVPFWLWGGLCLRCKKHPVLACLWGTWGMYTGMMAFFLVFFGLSSPDVNRFIPPNLLLLSLLLAATVWTVKREQKETET